MISFGFEFKFQSNQIFRRKAVEKPPLEHDTPEAVEKPPRMRIVGIGKISSAYRKSRGGRHSEGYGETMRRGLLLVLYCLMHGWVSRKQIKAVAKPPNMKSQLSTAEQFFINQIFRRKAVEKPPLEHDTPEAVEKPPLENPKRWRSRHLQLSP